MYQQVAGKGIGFTFAISIQDLEDSSPARWSLGDNSRTTFREETPDTGGAAVTGFIPEFSGLSGTFSGLFIFR